jgi:tripartite-type tricarboxylate transporter receptor subunit TctC
MLRRLAALLALAALLLPAAHAQETWPARPVRFIVPSSPGGGTDVFARLLGQALSDALKQQFVVENRPGGSGNVGASVAAKATPDGYTFLVSANPALSVNPSLYRNLTYSAERDFIPVARGVIAPMVLIAHPSLNARTLADLVAAAKRDPGKVAYGSAGTGSPPHLGIRMLEEVTGAKFLHVPYKGVGHAYQDLLGGQILFLLPDAASGLQHVRAGKVVPLAVDRRIAALPDTPTFDESGVPKFADQVFTSFSVAAPTGTPPAIVNRMSAEIMKAFRTPAFAEKLEAQSLVPVFDTPEAFAASLKKEREGWAAFIARNGIVAED